MIAGGGGLVCFFLLWNILSPNEVVVTPADPAAVSVGAYAEGVAPGAAASTPGSLASGYAAGTTSTAPSASTVQASVTAGGAARRTYALGLHELDGLPPDAAPGTRVELWVAWDPPITEETKIHKLLDDVVIEKLVPPSVPEGPVSVLLSIRAKDFSDLVWADRYGALSVAILP